MQGEWNGDFTRDTFDPRQQFLRVLMQQGRVQLDADWNEQISILLHYLQALAEDVIGAHGTPIRRSGFQIITAQSQVRDKTLDDFSISSGRYYVNGILCENSPIDPASNPAPALSYRQQKDYPIDVEAALPDLPFLVYLDVWERHLTYVQSSDLREIALGGADTATRSKLTWQVKAQALGDDDLSDLNRCEVVAENWSRLLQKWQSPQRGLLRARARVEENQIDPCIIHPESRYRGAENQLYRVEIHNGGSAEQATFKWSRENGSVVFAIASSRSDTQASGSTIALTLTLKEFWRDDRFGLKVNDWVEIVDEDYTLHQQPKPLLKVSKIEVDSEVRVTLTQPQRASEITFNRPLLLRRWDQQELDTSEEAVRRRSSTPRTEPFAHVESNGVIKLTEVDSNSAAWITLEAGVQIQFQRFPGDRSHLYRTGDYWLIPTRVATGDVEWEKRADGEPTALPPHGIHHHYAPLAVVVATEDEPKFSIQDCRRQFYSLARTEGYVGSSEGIGAELLWTES